eukprot:PhF_6_TR3272/c1_g1_i1/m.4631
MVFVLNLVSPGDHMSQCSIDLKNDIERDFPHEKWLVVIAHGSESEPLVFYGSDTDTKPYTIDDVQKVCPTDHLIIGAQCYGLNFSVFRSNYVGLKSGPTDPDSIMAALRDMVRPDIENRLRRGQQTRSLPPVMVQLREYANPVPTGMNIDVGSIMRIGEGTNKKDEKFLKYQP